MNMSPQNNQRINEMIVKRSKLLVGEITNLSSGPGIQIDWLFIVNEKSC